MISLIHFFEAMKTNQITFEVIKPLTIANIIKFDFDFLVQERNNKIEVFYIKIILYFIINSKIWMITTSEFWHLC